MTLNAEADAVFKKVEKEAREVEYFERGCCISETPASPTVSVPVWLCLDALLAHSG